MSTQKKILFPATPVPTYVAKEKEISAKPRAGSSEDRVMSNIIGWLLQGGVMLSSAVIILGLILLAFTPQAFSQTSVKTFPHTLGMLWIGLQSGQAEAVITLGLLLLIATPVLRVAVSVVAFGLEHDWRYVVITLIVLAILIISFTIGRGGA